ncbi:MAG: hypothetical protein U0X91_10185 [Spirosomataceae bacterium]
MKQKQIKFYSQEDNTIEKKKQAKEEEVIAYAHITSNGKLTLPLATLQVLGVDTTQSVRFKVGTDQNKKGFVGLYLIPVEEAGESSFELSRIGRGFSLLLKGIFQKLGLDYKSTYYRFILKPVELDGIGSGFFAKLSEQSARTNEQEDGE